MENVWDLGEAPEVDADAQVVAEYARKVNILTWYLDEYLPMAVGLECWGPNIRPFHLMTDKVEVEGDPSGKKKVLVTVTSEAFGLLLYANCREKWIAGFEWKAKQKTKKPKLPQYKKSDPSTHAFKAKWSNSRTGSVTGGGWDKEAFKYFEAMKTKIGDWREQEAADGNVNYTQGQNIIKVCNDIKQEDTGKPEPKRRKTVNSGAETEIVVVDITFLDE